MRPWNASNGLVWGKKKFSNCVFETTVQLIGGNQEVQLRTILLICNWNTKLE